MSDPAYYPPAPNYPPPPPNPWGPFTAGDLLRRTFKLYGEHPALFLSIGAVAAAAGFVIQAPNQIINFAFQSHPPVGVAEQFSRSLLTLALSLVVLLASALVYAVTHGVIYAMVVSLRRGTVPTLTAAFEAVAPRFLRLAAGYLLVILRLFGWGMLAVIPIMVLFVLIFALIPGIATRAAAPGSAAMVGVTAVIVVLLIALLLLPFFFWLYLRYSLFVPVILEENLGANASVRRSIELTRHGKGRLAALYGFVLLLSIPVAVLGGTVGFLGAKHHTTSFLIMELAALLVGSLFSAVLITPVYGIGIALCYFDLRARKDSAPVATPPLPAAAPAWQPPVAETPVTPTPAFEPPPPVEPSPTAPEPQPPPDPEPLP